MFGFGKEPEKPVYRPPVEPYAPPEPRHFNAHTYSGDERPFLTLVEARNQVDVWMKQGIPGFITNSRDPEWEDLPEEIPTVGEAKEFSPEFVFAAIGPDPKAVERFAFDLLELNGYELDYQDGAVVVYDNSGA